VAAVLFFCGYRVREKKGGKGKMGNIVKTIQLTGKKEPVTNQATPDISSSFP